MSAQHPLIVGELCVLLLWLLDAPGPFTSEGQGIPTTAQPNVVTPENSRPCELCHKLLEVTLLAHHPT